MLHVVSIAGAVGLAAAIWWLTSLIQAAGHDAALASGWHERVQLLQLEAHELSDSLNPEASNAAMMGGLARHRASYRWMAQLVVLRDALGAPSQGMVDGAIQPLEAMVRYGQQRSTDLGHVDGASLDSLRQDVKRYGDALDRLEDQTHRLFQARQTLVTKHSRLAMLLIALLCIVYLAAVEHTRHWTTRRLVRPVEELAAAAIGAMDGRQQLPDLEHCGTLELKTLAKMLSGFVATLKEKVDDRTA